MSAPPPTNASEYFSPLTLGNEWPKAARLLFIVTCATIGTIMNGFFIAAFFVERSLRTPGNVFHACVGIADFIITAVIMPVCAVILLSGQWDTKEVCNALVFLAEGATFSYNMHFLLVAAENYYRICFDNSSEIFTSGFVTVVSVLVFVHSFGTAGIGVYLDLDYDYCTRASDGHYIFRVGSVIAYQILPFIVITLTFVMTTVYIRRRARKQINYKRSHQFNRDYESTILNLTAYLFFAITWMPYVAVVNEYPNSADVKYYHCAWLGISRSAMTSFLYAFLNRDFRRAYAHLFNYCCCKITLASSSMTRHRLALEYRPMIPDVRVHVMHQAILVNGVPRYTSSVREIQEL